MVYIVKFQKNWDIEAVDFLYYVKINFSRLCSNAFC